jgi:hypothetical protein
MIMAFDAFAPTQSSTPSREQLTAWGYSPEDIDRFMQSQGAGGEYSLRAPTGPATAPGQVEGPGLGVLGHQLGNMWTAVRGPATAAGLAYLTGGTSLGATTGAEAAGAGMEGAGVAETGASGMVGGGTGMGTGAGVVNTGTVTGADMSAAYGGDTASAAGLGGNAAVPAAGAASSGLGTAAGGLGSIFTPSNVKTLGGIYDAYAKTQQGNQQMDRYKQVQDSINNYYAPGSPEANLMRQTIERQDAAAGRNSQYGTRETEIAAKIAQAKMQAQASMLTGQNQMFNQSLQNTYGAPSSLAAIYGQQNTPSMTSRINDVQNTANTVNSIHDWLTT